MSITVQKTPIQEPCSAPKCLAMSAYLVTLPRCAGCDGRSASTIRRYLCERHADRWMKLKGINLDWLTIQPQSVTGGEP